MFASPTPPLYIQSVFTEKTFESEGGWGERERAFRASFKVYSFTKLEKFFVAGREEIERKSQRPYYFSARVRERAQSVIRL